MQGRYGWMMVAMLFIAGAVSFLDRAALSVVAPLILRDLDLTASSLGVIFSAFFIGYSALCFLGGIAADRYGPRRVLLYAMVFWSLFCGLTAATTTFASLLVVRVLFGMAEGPFLSNANKLIGNWIPVSRQAMAISIAQSGTTLGGAIAGPIVGALALAYGWRVSFVVIAGAGFVWVIGWQLLGRSAPTDSSKVAEPETHDRPPIAEEGTPGTLVSYLREPAVLAIGFAFFGFGYLLYFFLSWFPSYLTMERHLSIKDMSVVSTIPWLMGFIGYLLGGAASDYVLKVTGRAVYARKIVLVVCLLAAAVCVAIAGYADSVWSAAALMGTSILFLYMSANSYWALILNMIPKEKVGAVGGYVHMFGNFAGIAAPTVTGYIVQKTGVFNSAFALAGGVALLGSVCIAVFVQGQPPREGVPMQERAA
ncbi:sugar phosphate permease [Paraburkholderia silvatlantica]|uniref:Sugar phosphate permease n=1 Tax=Paraburkholderia silvatlantica TaxID=321895 RepID=A0A2V4U3E6_9BURK|nr:MFS transporter [Paraburkholderia silvatlantica]PYE25464.1 sugar phosphate permease [Paraburkholderia silvatlantica]